MIQKLHYLGIACNFFYLRLILFPKPVFLPHHRNIQDGYSQRNAKMGIWNFLLLLGTRRSTSRTQPRDFRHRRDWSVSVLGVQCSCLLAWWRLELLHDLTFKLEIQTKAIFITLTNAGKRLSWTFLDTSRESKKIEVLHKTEHSKSVTCCPNLIFLSQKFNPEAFICFWYE